MSSIYRYVPPAILTMGSMVSIWFLICNLQPLKPVLYAFAICIIFGLYLTLKLFNNDFLITAKKHLFKLSQRKYFVVAALSVITVVGLLARLFFYLRFTYVPQSDPMTFYDSAIALASNGNLLGDSYVAFQPYLSAYNNILGGAMRLISDPWLATILLNTFFDVLSALAIYLLLKKLLKPSSLLPTIAFGVWTLSPLNVIFSVISLPVIIVNFFVILTILVSYYLIQQVTGLRTKHALFLSVILGLVLGLGNCFRPIFIVTIIALTVIFVFMFLTTHRSTKFLKTFTGCLLLSMLIFLGIQRLNLALVSNQTGLSAAQNPSGWSMYVGSTWESDGDWRSYHNDELAAICANSLPQNDYDKCHEELKNAAIDRYKNYGILGSSSLMVRKLYRQSEDQTYFYNAEQSIVGYTTSRTFKLINVYSTIYAITLFILSAKFLYGLARRSLSNRLVDPTLLFIAITMIGWFFALMFVQSAPRYSTIFYPIFIIFSVLALDNKFTSNRGSKIK